MMNITLNKSEIAEISAKICNATEQNGHDLTEKEINFLLHMDHQLRERQRSIYTAKQAKWLLDILAGVEARSSSAA